MFQEFNLGKNGELDSNHAKTVMQKYCEFDLKMTNEEQKSVLAEVNDVVDKSGKLKRKQLSKCLQFAKEKKTMT